MKLSLATIHQEEKDAEWDTPPREWPRRDLRSPDDCLNIDQTILEEYQLKAVQKQFIKAYSEIAAVKDLADRQGIKQISTLNDLAPILFNHTAYKSYPLSFIEKKKYSQLTKWLDKFTTLDIGNIKLDNPKTIDEWFDQLEEKTQLEPVHSSGTTGKLSIIPRSKIDMDNYVNAFYFFMEKITAIDFHKERIPVFVPGYQTGRQIATKVFGTFGPKFAGSEEDYHYAYPGRLSADFMSLAGRVKVAKAKGELGKMQLLRSLVHNKGELIKAQIKMPKLKETFMEKFLSYKGRKVFFMGLQADFIKTAIEGHDKGERNVFAPGSGFVTGGGMKGYTPPEGWYQKTLEFYGIKSIPKGYGMTEMNGGGLPSCECGNYHFFPWHIPFILDPETGEVAPREGVQTGRFAFFDLLAENYWGGFITGDKITIHYDQCECGAKAAWLESNIARYSELQGGDDKISCAGVQESYEDFIDFLMDEEEY
jgi:hypothetical protein